MEEKKYRLLKNESIVVVGRTLYRIEALRDFGDVKAGDKGGFVEREMNLSHSGNCWVYDNAKVYDYAEVYDNARVCDGVEVYGSARVYGSAKVRYSAEVCGSAEVSGYAEVEGDDDYIVFKNWWSSGRYFTWTRSNNMWRVGCFYGTGDDLVKKAYSDSERSGREYERIVRYVEEILKDGNKD